MNADANAQPNAPDPTAWLAEHGDVLFRYALAHTHNRAAAEDAVQETLLAALSAYQTFRGGSTERTWLIGILRHKVIDHARKAAREPRSQDPQAGGDPATDEFTPSGKWRAGPRSWGGNPHEAFEKQEFWDVFEKCLGRLPPRTATAYTLREMDELPTEEICELLESSATNLWTLLHRARLWLRKCLEMNWFTGEK